MEPRGWHICSELSSIRGIKSCCSKAIYLAAKNDQVKVADLIMRSILKIKNTEKVFEKSSQN